MNYKRLFLENSLIFITIVTNNRFPFLIENINLLKNSFLQVLKIYKFKLIAYSVQPDHIHCIIKPKQISDYPNIIKSFKYSFTRNVGLVKPTYKNLNIKIWQNRYWEHTIKNNNDLTIHLNYIHYNAVKHNLTKNVKDWEYSSFQKFVKRGLYEINWGSNTDIANIINLNFE